MTRALPAEISARLRRYVDLVREWAPRLDLVATGDLDRFEERHVEDSLRLLPLLAEIGPGSAVDVGSGAGLPGIPLAIADPGRRWRLLEPRARRAAFLEEVVRELDLSCTVLAMTVESAARDQELRGANVFAVARALAEPARAFELLEPLLSAAGVAAVFVGESAVVPPDAGLWRPGIAIVDPANVTKRE